MKIITLDYESYWAVDYSVSKMSPLEYVLGDRFELQTCSIKVDDGPTEVFFGEEDIRNALVDRDFENNACLAHNNSGFDAYITAYRLKLRPRLWMCTKAMSTPLNSKTVGNSLKQLVRKYHVGIKDDAVLHATKGRYLRDFTPQEIDDMRTYNKADTEQCYAIYKKMRPHFSKTEMWLIDATVRQRTEPMFVLDTELLERTLIAEKAAKRTALLELAKLLKVEETDEEVIAEAVRSILASAPRFARLLETRGVEVPLKPSPKHPDKLIPALAKTDEAFIALQESDDEIVSVAATTRLAIKSTQLETRIVKFLEAFRLAGNALPVPIRYCGADTTGRPSGEEYNMLNLPRINRKAPKRSDALRDSVMAPEGHSILVCDQSGIELRVNHTLWQVPSSMALWQDDPEADLYREYVAKQLGISPEEVDDLQRQFAKAQQLGLGFGAGTEAFRKIARILSGGKVDLSVVHRYMTEVEAKAGRKPVLVDSEGYAMVVERDPAEEGKREWRAFYVEIVNGWKRCHSALPYIRDGVRFQIDPWGLCFTEKDAIVLPSGRRIRYPDLRQEADKKTGKIEWVYGHGRHKARIYAGKINENIVQALARDSCVDYMVDFYNLTGLRPQLWPYDELAYVLPTADAERLEPVLAGVMRKPLRWWPELVVWSKSGVARRYGDAK